MANRIVVKIPKDFTAKTAKQIKRRINEAIDKPLLTRVSDFIINKIRMRKNPSTGKNFKKLKDSTIEWRGNVAKKNPTHPAYQQSLSNLTLTGELIDSITATISVRNKAIFIRPIGKHPGYIGDKRKKPSNNIDIAKGQKENGRNILAITKKGAKQILKILQDGVNKKFK